MNIYNIGGKQYAVIGEELYERVESGTIGAREEDPLAELAPKRRKYTRTVASKPKPKKARRGSIHCKICDGYGHFAKTCPKGPGKLKAPRKKMEKRTYQPPEQEEAPAVDNRTDEELRAAVHGLQQDGLDSLVIASKLRLRISKVNELWDPTIASKNGKAEEEEDGEVS